MSNICVDSPEWLAARQRSYDALLHTYTIPGDRASQQAFDLHKRIVEQVNALSIDEGGLAP